MLLVCKRAWYHFFERYYEILLQDCIDPKEKMKLLAKSIYYSNKKCELS